MSDPLDNASWSEEPEENKPVKKRTTKKTAVGKATGKKAKKTKSKKKTKKQQHAEQWSLANLNRATGMALQSMVAETGAKTGKVKAAMLPDTSGFVIGIPWPSFALEYLTCNIAVPLEKTIQIYGPRGIGKSGFAFELMRIWRKHHGIGHLFEHESKFNPAWARSIIGWWESDCLGVIPCTSINEWETELQRAVKQVKRIMTGDSKTLGAGRIFPWLGIVDSIMGKPFQETIDNVEEKGYAGRGHPIEAKSITVFVKAFASQMDEWPFALVCINHQRINPSPDGMNKKDRSGGQTIDFQGSFEFEVTRKKRIRTASLDGNQLIIRCEKNSYGEDKRKIEVDCIWYDHEEENPHTGEKEIHQQTVWDWDGATVKLLTRPESKGQVWTDARKLCGGLVKVSDGKFYAPGLGVPKTKATSPFNVGLKIRNNPKILQRLRDMFSVRAMRLFRNDVDYLEQLLSANKALAKVGGRSV